MDIKKELKNPGPVTITAILTGFTLAGVVSGAGIVWGILHITAVAAG